MKSIQSYSMLKGLFLLLGAVLVGSISWSQNVFRNYFSSHSQLSDDNPLYTYLYIPEKVMESDDFYIASGTRITNVQGPTIEIIYDTTAPYFLVIDKITGSLVTNEQIRNETCDFKIRAYTKSSSGFIGVGTSRSPQDSCIVSWEPVAHPINPRLYMHSLNSKGELLWQKNFVDSNHFYFGHSVQPMNDGNYVVRGNKRNKESGVFKRFFMIVTEDGDSITSIDLSYWVGGTHLFKKYSEGYYLVTNIGDCIKFNHNLDSITSYSIPAISDNRQGFFFLKDETFMMSRDLTTGTGGKKARLTKYNKNFEVEWQNTYEGIWAGESFAEVSDGNYVVGYKDFAKVSPEGEILWSHNYFEDDPFQFGYIAGIIETSDGGFLISARTKNFNLMLVKTDCEGNLEWSNSSCKRPSENNFDLYPNPVSDIAHLQLSNIEDGQEVSVNVSNLAGQIVKRYVSTNTLLNLDLSELSTGVYYYSIYVNGVFYDSSKLVKI